MQARRGVANYSRQSGTVDATQHRDHIEKYQIYCIKNKGKHIYYQQVF